MGFPGGSVVKNLPANAGDTEAWVQSLGQEDPLEEEMATHSSILAWTIPWTEEPGGLQCIGLQRVRHDWAHTHTRLHAPLCPQVHSQLLRLYSWPTTRIFFKDYILCYSFVNIHIITVLLLFIIYANISTYEYKYDVSIHKYYTANAFGIVIRYLYRTTISICSNLREWEQWWVTSEEKSHGWWQGTDEMGLLRQKMGGNKCLRRIL